MLLLRAGDFTENGTKNGAGEWFLWEGGRGCFTAGGTFGSGTAKLQFRVPYSSSTWSEAFDITDASFTSAGGVNVDVPGGCQVRGNISGASSPALKLSLMKW